MKPKHKVVFILLTIITLALSAVLYSYAIDSAVLDPKGIIALKERDLMYVSTLLMLIVVIPVLILTFAICLRYRASNKEAEYTPKWDFDFLAEAIWWGFPCFIVIILSVVTWYSSRDLDPYKPMSSKIKPVRIQVVALPWKWLFIYPEQNIASVNFFQFPEQVPINFEITADAPMNSFWIPQLAGQIYAMPGMNTKLHLSAEEPGDFRGSSANLSGEGFSGMTFIARASSQTEFDDPVITYVLKDHDLYEQIVMKYMMPKEKQ